MKQRLVGTLVLGSLALILIPLLLDGEGVERPPLSATTPPAPMIDTNPLPEPTRPGIANDSTDSAFELAGEAADDSAANADAADELSESSGLASSVDEADIDDGIEAASATARPPATVAADTVASASTASPGNSAAADRAATPPAATPPAVTPAAAATPAPPPEPATAAARSTSTPALDAAGLPEAWTVRLGSFGNRANADALVARLVAAGHKAYIRPVQTAQGALSGVFVGPVATRNEASKLQAELKSTFRINDAIVQRFNIAE